MTEAGREQEGGREDRGREWGELGSSMAASRKAGVWGAPRSWAGRGASAQGWLSAPAQLRRETWLLECAAGQSQ